MLGTDWSDLDQWQPSAHELNSISICESLLLFLSAIKGYVDHSYIFRRSKRACVADLVNNLLKAGLRIA